LSRDWLAFLDTGSSVSILGDKVIEFLRKKNVTTQSNSKVISSLQGSLTTAESVMLNVDYGAGVKKHRFLLVPGTITTILLGRDFIGPTNLGIFIGQGGWTLGSETQKLIPFERNMESFLTQSTETTHVAQSQGSRSTTPSLVGPSFINENEESDEEIESSLAKFLIL
jgi:hypothetical protein